MFFKDIEDYKKCIPVNASFKLSVIEIFLREVDRTLFKKYLGKTFLDTLQTTFDNAVSFESLAAPYKDLIEQLRICSANAALAKWLPTGQVSISQAGIQITSTADQKTAFQWQIKDIEDSSNEIAFNALEDALEYLEAYIDSAEFATYKASDEFKENNYLFVSSAKEFCKYYSSFSNSRVNFFKLRSAIRKVEDFEIKAIISPSYFNNLKATLNAGDAFGDLAQTIVEMIKPALVNLAVARAVNDLSVVIGPNGILTFDNTAGRQTIDSKKQAPDASLARIAFAAESDGRNYLKILADYLEANKDDYPLFKNDAEYIAPEDEVDMNDGTKPFYTGI